MTGRTEMDSIMDEVLLQFNNVALSYERTVVSDFTFELKQGEIMALVGESGSGKSSVLKSILGIPEMGVRVITGTIRFQGKVLNEMGIRERRKLLGEYISMIFQDPGAAFNPIRSYRKQFSEMLKSHGKFQGQESYRQIEECFRTLQLPRPEQILDCCPYEMSGGMNQRIAIAAAMQLTPRLLLADEPTSALDVTTQKLVIEELMRMQHLSGMSMVVVTHNLGVAAKMAERTGIMYAGRMIEFGKTSEILKHPSHPYTKGLIESVPKLGGIIPGGVEGQPPLFGAELDGCAFEPRCTKRGKCAGYNRSMKKIAEDHWSCCGE